MKKWKIMKNLHRLLSGFFLTAPIMVLLAYIKNDILKPSFVDILIGKMVKDWNKMTILDLGCGPCNKEADRRFKGVNITCVDIFKPYLKICQKYGFKTIHTDIKEIGFHVSQNSVDIIWVLDVIEHLEKKEGLRLLNQIEKIAKKQVIIFVPLGWLPQDTTNDGNIYQKHKSAWYKKDFEKRGYKCEILPNYHFDIRQHSRVLSNKQEPIASDAMWAILIK